MGDVSELRTLVFVGSFISVLVLLFSLTPTQFFTYSGGRQIEVPVTWEGFLLTSSGNYTKTWDGFIDDGAYLNYLYRQEVDDGSGTFGGWEIRLATNKAISGSISIYKQNFWWIIPTDIELMNWRTFQGKDYGDSLTRSELNEVYSQTGSLDFGVSLSYLSFDVLFSYNTTEYVLPTDAWDSNELLVLCGIGFDQVQQSVDTWNFIRQLLFFQLPDIHPVIVALISFPLWIAIAYVAYILILRTIGAVFGGGA